jgi:spermidine/putrescine-binding protein
VVKFVCIVPAFMALLAACGGSSQRGTGEEQTVNLYIWTNYVAPGTLAGFTAQSGIKVNVSYFDSNETLEGRLLTGHSGFDVVVPSANFVGREIKSGAFLAFDKSRLSNLSHLDPALMRQIAADDPGNQHAVDYTFGTVGIGYNQSKVHALTVEPPDSWGALFDPAIARQFSACGIGIIDSPAEMVRLALIYLHRDPDVPTEEDLAQVETMLLKARPFIRLIASDTVEPLANGDICMAVAYNGGVMQSRNRAREAHNGVDIAFVLPKEGSLLWADLLAIPKDAPHPANAYRLIDYLLEPRVIAAISNATGYANGNLAARPLIDPKVKEDPATFPSEEELRRLRIETDDTPAQTRSFTRIWQRFKSGV